MTDTGIDEQASRRFDEFSPKKILLQLIGTLKYIRSKWLILIIGGLLVGLLYVGFNYNKKPKYTASITFALDEGAVQSSTNDLPSIAQELGFGTSYQAGGVFSSMTNILELFQSRLLIEKTLLREVAPEKDTILFVNFFLDSLQYRNKWMLGSAYENINFRNTKAGKEETIFRNGIINNTYDVLTKTCIKIDRKGKGTSLIQATLTTENESFSKYFLEALIDEVSKFYIEIKTQRAKLHLDFIQKRTDSVRNAFNNSLYGRAQFTDANINPNVQIAVVPIERKQTDVTILKENYINLVKSLESAKTSLMQDTPLFQYLDVPVFPLEKVSMNLLFKFILFFIIGCILTAIGLVIARFYRFILDREVD